MSRQENANLVAQIVLKTNTYYVTDRTGGILLDGNTYENVVIEWSDVPHVGNLGNGEYEVGAVNIIINNGEEYEGAGYRFDPTDVWNNYKMTVRRYINGTHFKFEDCIPFAKGLIKNHKINQDKMVFAIEEGDNRDDQLLPAILCQDQGGLSDAEAQTTARYWGQANYLEFTNPGIFSIGELVKITNPNGITEYARIKSKSANPSSGGTNVFFYANTINTPWAFDFTNTVEKAFRYLPKSFVDKTIPMQYGDLNRPSDGIFGKTITPNEKVGFQSIVADHLTLNNIDSVGVWERGTKRYFKARASETIEGLVEGEYTINNSQKSIDFVVDSAATLTTDIIDTSDGITDFYVSDYTKLQWEDEDTQTEWEDYPELLSMNILAIDAELMMIVAKPLSNIIYCERGFGGTEITTHSAGTKIFQSAKFSAKNLLTFTELFKAKAMANQYWGFSHYGSRQQSEGVYPPPYGVVPSTIVSTAPSAGIKTGKLSNIVDDNISSSVTYGFSQFTRDGIAGWAVLWSNLDLKFDQTEDDFTVYRAFAGIKYDITLDYPASVSGVANTIIGIYNTSTQTNRADKPYQDDNGTQKDRSDLPLIVNYNATGDVTSSYDSYTGIDRAPYNVSAINNPDIFTDGLSITTIKELNKKWKLSIGSIEKTSVGSRTVLKDIVVYEFGLWFDIFVNFTQQTIVSPLLAREIDFNVVDIVGNASPDTIGDVIENPVDVVAHLLALELKYNTRGATGLETTEFTDNWQGVHDYVEDSTNYEITSPDSPTPECAMSYGVNDERKEGWSFVSWVASHFNLQIIKTYDGKIDIINLHEIYNDTPAGNEIKIEDILFLPQSGNRRITIHQTGTDLIYNDIIVPWKRNNSTDEYQETYILPDSYTLVKSGITLATARDDYYSGEKRNLTIPSPFIYNEQDARRLAEWKADDQAEVHFYVDFHIDFMHYSEINSLSEQYKDGDIIYLTGDSSGITFNINRKFYIQNIIFTDSGREVKIQAKSVDPVTLF